MEEITFSDFIDFLLGENNKLSNYKILVDNESLYKTFYSIGSNKIIENCTFHGEFLKISPNIHPQKLNTDKIIHFNNCAFDVDEISISNLYIKNLIFKQCVIKKLDIIHSSFEYLGIFNYNYRPNCGEIVNSIKINISESNINKLTFNNLVFGDLFINSIKSQFVIISNCEIKNLLDLSSSWLQNLEISKNKINEIKINNISNLLVNNIYEINELDKIVEKIFINGGSIKTLTIENFSNKLNNLNIISVDIEKLHLNQFLNDKTLITNIQNLKYLYITNITSNKSFIINQCKSSNISIENSTFFNIIEFDNIINNRLSLVKNYFDKIKINDLEINNLKALNIDTSRVLKKYYNTVGDYTLESEYKKIEKDLIFKEKIIYLKNINSTNIYTTLKKYINILSDIIILLTTKYTSNHGTRWIQSFFASLIVGFTFYTIIFISLNFDKNFVLNEYNINNFLNGLLKFFVLTDYTDPTNIEKVYIKNSFLNLILIVGKLLLSICIYETIISFRKYHK